jgi:hypothetical protein
MTAGATGTALERAARHFAVQAGHCETLGSPLYASLLRQASADLLAGGPTAEVLGGHVADPWRDAAALRLLGGAHALALTGRAPELAAFYPSAGGTADPGPDGSRAWSALRHVLVTQGEFVRAWLEHPPQTNEVGRGAVLAGGLCHLVNEADLPVRLVEVGASAGLNLRADRFWISGPGESYGDPSSPVRLAGGWAGHPPPARQVTVLLRTGGDVSPVDPLSQDGRTRLTAYVWPDQTDRLARLRGAFDLAATVQADLRAEPASRTIARTSLEPGTWTVVWHSIMRHYLDAAEARALADGVAALGAAASGSARFAYLTFELVRDGEPPVEMTTWPGGVRRQLGTAPAHGVPVRWT